MARGMRRRRRVLAVANGGGHILELLRLYPAFADEELYFMTSSPTVLRGYRHDGFLRISDYSRWDKLRMAVQGLQIAWRVLRLRPDVVISTGAAAGLLAIAAGKRLARSRTIWVDTLASAERLSMSGRLARRWADLYLTQWEHLAAEGGPRYAGAIL